MTTDQSQRHPLSQSSLVELNWEEKKKMLTLEFIFKIILVKKKKHFKLCKMPWACVSTFWKPAKLQLTHKLFSLLSSCVLMQNQSASKNLISQKMGWYCSTISVAKVCHGPRLINVHLGIFNLGCLVWGKIKIAPSRRVTPRYNCNQSD